MPIPMGVYVPSALQVGDGAEQVIELAAAARADVVGLSEVKTIASTAAIVDRQHDVALGDEVLIKCVYPAIRTLGIEPEQHLPSRAAMEEQNRRVRLGAGLVWHEQLRVRFLAIFRNKGHCLGHDELGTREGGWNGFRSDRSPLPLRTQHDWMHWLVAVALQREKSAVGSNLRKVFDGVALSDAHCRTMPGIDRPDVHPVGVILSRRIDQALAVWAEDEVCDFELSRRECAGIPTFRGHGVQMQPATFLPGEHEIIMVGPEQVRR